MISYIFDDLEICLNFIILNAFICFLWVWRFSRFYIFSMNLFWVFARSALFKSSLNVIYDSTLLFIYSRVQVASSVQFQWTWFWKTWRINIQVNYVCWNKWLTLVITHCTISATLINICDFIIMWWTSLHALY